MSEPAKFAQYAKSFNSNMVRLRELKAVWDELNQICFNSNMVRLRANASIYGRKLHLGFNSNMVRLRVRCTMLLLRRLFLFQFQYGAIERVKWVGMVELDTGFNSNMVRLRVGTICYSNTKY